MHKSYNITKCCTLYRVQNNNICNILSFEQNMDLMLVIVVTADFSCINWFVNLLLI